MKRRTFIAALGGAAAWPLAARAQGPPKVHRIGILTTDYAGDPANSVTFRLVPALRRLNYIEGRNLEILWRGAAGDASKLPILAQELIVAHVELIVAVSLSSIKAAKESTNGIPIVMGYIDDDPVAAGLAASLARPGGNVTGVWFLGAETDAKRFELLAETFGIETLWSTHESSGFGWPAANGSACCRNNGCRVEFHPRREPGRLRQCFC
jgi:putative tryptophan/tyrosine transport system substrate-binding protein